MQRKQLSIMLVAAGLLIVSMTGLALVNTQPAQACSAPAHSAQCGSQVSSCKNCHETQGKKPVNSDGTAWHQGHAFGDFCSSCHGGNQQSADQTAAHADLVSPLADIRTSCQQCHPNDLQVRAQVFASALGVQLGSLDSARPTVAPAAATTEAAPEPSAPQAAGLDVNNSNLVDYVQRYDQNALGQGPVNWGDVILLVMIVGMLLAGGALVLHNEKLVVISFKDTRPVEGLYPADVVAMVPELSQLKPAARQSLRRLLGRPDVAADLLASLDKLAGADRQGQINTKDTKDTKEDQES